MHVIKGRPSEYGALGGGTSSPSRGAAAGPVEPVFGSLEFDLPTLGSPRAMDKLCFSDFHF